MEGGDDEFAQELEGLDIAKVREKITLVQAERERQAESIERLQEKLKALNYELAARKEVADRQKRHFQQELEVKRGEEKSKGGGLMSSIFGSNTGAVVVQNAPASTLATTDDQAEQEKEHENARRLIEEQLQKEMGRSDRPRNKYGTREFGERELMIEGFGAEEGEGPSVDTVLITHRRSTSSEETYHLSYRVGKHTTARKLREDACVYFGISEVEYVLWTLNQAKVADDMRVQDCFDPSESAHLILTPKVPVKTDPMEKVLDLIGAKAGPKKVRRGKNPQQNTQAQAEEKETLFEQISKIPGVWKFMTQHDKRETEHTQRIWPTSICTYTVLLILTLVMIGFLRAPIYSYNCRLGVLELLKMDPVQPYSAIRSQSEAWTWLTDVVGPQLFANSSDLRTANYVPGWVRVRMQQVREPSSASCPFAGKLPAGTTCYDAVYAQGTEGKEDIATVRQYWDGKAGVDGRSATTLPWQFLSSEQGAASGVAPQAGRDQDFDASGYAVDYNLQHGDLSAVMNAYMQDMLALRDAGWLSDRTRAVHLTFSAYNGNYDMWVSLWFLLEMPATGLVVTTSDVDVYSPSRDDAHPKLGQYMYGIDTCRMVLVIVGILIYQIPSDVIWAQKHGGNCLSHFQNPDGVADLCIVAIYFAIYIVRWVYTVSIGYQPLERSRALSASFMDETLKVYAYRQNIVLEAFVLLFLVYRFGKLMRLNRSVYLIWTTLSKSMSRCFRFLLIFVPVVVGLIVVGHTLWLSQAPEYRTFWSSATSILMVLLGDLQAIRVVQDQRPWTAIYIVSLYVFVVLLFINTWGAVLIQEYQKVRVSRGYNPVDYRWTEYDYVNWFFPEKLAKLYVNKLRPSIKPVKNDDDD